MPPLRFKEDELSVSSSSSSSSSSNIDCKTAQSSAVCVMDVSAETEAAPPPPLVVLLRTEMDRADDDPPTPVAGMENTDLPLLLATGVWHSSSMWLLPPPRTLLVPTIGRPAAEEEPLVPCRDWYLPPTWSCSSASKSLLSSLSSLSESTRSNRSRSGSISRAEAAPPPAAAEEEPAPAEGRPLAALAAGAAGRRA